MGDAMMYIPQRVKYEEIGINRSTKTLLNTIDDLLLNVNTLCHSGCLVYRDGLERYLPSIVFDKLTFIKKNVVITEENRELLGVIEYMQSVCDQL